jgi:hypothetical protein
MKAANEPYFHEIETVGNKYNFNLNIKIFNMVSK